MLEIACDESGYEGEKLIGTSTDVFAHASVRLDARSAASCLRELRARIRSPALEYKANHLLRAKHVAVLRWLLGRPPAGVAPAEPAVKRPGLVSLPPAGVAPAEPAVKRPGLVSQSAPLSGNAYVYLVDKAYFVLARLVELLVPDQPAEPLARDLYRAELDPELWHAFLAAANLLLRTNHRAEVTEPVDSFAGTVDALRRAGAPGPVDEVLGRLHHARPRAVAFRERLHDDPRAVPTLDPLVPAIIRAVAGWAGDGGEPVTIVHDRQKTLSPDRIAHLADRLGPRLAGLRFVAARSDPRVQVADILAGVARKLATDELHGRADPQLTALLRPYLDPFSIWGDDRSWSRLA